MYFTFIPAGNCIIKTEIIPHTADKQNNISSDETENDDADGNKYSSNTFITSVKTKI